MKSVLLIAVCLLFHATAAEPTNVVRQIGPNTFEIGAVRLEAKERRVIIPATVNMVDGPVEYVLVSALGKLHESILKTTVEPLHVHTAMLLLSKQAISTQAPPRVTISIEWDAEKNRSVPIESVIDNTTGKRLTPAPWRYSGSRVSDGVFIAQRDGSIISIIADPDALIENGRVSAEDDENWRPLKKELPALGTPVKVVLTMEPKTEKKD